jgi:hypothetical protein
VFFHVDIPYEREKRLSISLEWMPRCADLPNIKLPRATCPQAPAFDRRQKHMSVFGTWCDEQQTNTPDQAF